jgi:hypothetical protein
MTLDEILLFMGLMALATAGAFFGNWFGKKMRKERK